MRGNAGAIAGVAIRGAEVVVHGNIGSRAGQVMKAGTLCCAGNANFMAGYMMYGGRLVICGDSGRAGRPGHDTAARSTSAAAIESLGTDAMQIDLPAEEEDDLLALPRPLRDLVHRASSRRSSTPARTCAIRAPSRACA